MRERRGKRKTRKSGGGRDVGIRNQVVQERGAEERKEWERVVEGWPRTVRVRIRGDIEEGKQ